MRDTNLVLLSLDLDIPNLWENSLVQNFPNSTFTIKNAFPSGDESFSGILKIKNSNYGEISSHLKENFSSVSIEPFHEESEIYHFSTPDNILPYVLRNSKSILSWPVDLMEKRKRVKFILRDSDVEKIMIPLEKKKIPITKFSKLKIDFDFKEILTSKQKEILAPSLNHGYYDFPKRISLNNLSHKIGISPSTLCVHLQKIESKIFNSSYKDIFL